MSAIEGLQDRCVIHIRRVLNLSVNGFDDSRICHQHCGAFFRWIVFSREHANLAD